MKPTFKDIESKLFEMRSATVSNNPKHKYVGYFDEIYAYIAEQRAENNELGKALAKIQKG